MTEKNEKILKNLNQNKRLFIFLIIFISVISIIAAAITIAFLLKYFVFDNELSLERNPQCNIICSVGYKSSVVSGACECVDIDECKENLSICKSGYKCLNNYGTYKCVAN